MTRTRASTPPSPPHIHPGEVGIYVAITFVAVVIASGSVFEGLMQPIDWRMIFIGLAGGGIMQTTLLIVVAKTRDLGLRTSTSTVLTSSGFGRPRPIWSTYRCIESLLLGVVVPIALVFVWLQVLDPLLRSATSITPVFVSADRANWYAGLPMSLMIVSIAAGVIGEELLFRGPGLCLWQLRDRVENRASRRVLTIVSIVVGGGVLSVAAFGFHHGTHGAWNVFLGSTFGALFYPLVLATRSLWPSVVGHLVWNLDAWGVVVWIH